MYLPPHFRQDDRAAVRRLIAATGLGELVTFDGSSISASSVPMLLDESSSREVALLGHLARANPQWSSFDPAVEALALFRGPHAYVSPSWYPAKAEHGRVVPTWDYLTVQASGRLEVHDEDEWKLELVTRLTAIHEGPRPRPWSVADAPAAFVAAQLRAIVGFELRISRLEAKWKLGQNQPEASRLGAAAGLAAEAGAAGAELAAMIRGLPPDEPAPGGPR